MDPDERAQLATRGTVEIIQRGELERLLVENERPRAYWGFECSGMRAMPARNDARRPRARLRRQDTGSDKGRIPVYDLPSRLSLDDQQQVRGGPAEDQDDGRILPALLHGSRRS